jgi:hypothetical protein
MPTHRPVRVGVAVLGILGLTAPAWGQAAPPPAGNAGPDRPSAGRSAYEAFVPLLERDEPHPSFWGEADPPASAEPAEVASEPPAPPAAGGEQAKSDDGGASHEHH